MQLGFSPMTAMMFDTDACFRLADELGLTFLELAYDLHEVMPALQDPQRIRDLVAATGVGVTVHLSFVDLNLASLMPAARRTAVERTQRGLGYAAEVGATCAVLHTGQRYLRHPLVDPMVDAALDDALRSLTGTGVPIALENLALGPHDLVRTPEALRDLTARHGLHNCLDFGHAHVQGTRDGWSALPAYLEVLGDAIVHLHLHNNHGESDEHLATDDGSLDYEPYRAFLSAFQGTICLEIADAPPAGGEAALRASVAHLRGLVGAST